MPFAGTESRPTSLQLLKDDIVWAQVRQTNSSYEWYNVQRSIILICKCIRTDIQLMEL